ncbi:MAG TPA: hypothetical protein VFN30_03515 [Chitinophagaceae bacterium]|nr:hypothetical protein [Chitinophagaceae bacterium]
MKKGIFILVLLIALFSCTKEKKVVMRYYQTQCNDKWGYGSNDTETIQNMVTYFKDRGIIIYSPSLSLPDGSYICRACICPTNRKFAVSVEEDNVERMIAEGFYR